MALATAVLALIGASVAHAANSLGNPSAPSVTTTGASRLVLAFYANKKPATFSGYTAPAVERWDRPNTSGGLPSNAMASYELPAAGASGAKSASASEQAEWVAQQIAISPGGSVTKFLWDVSHPLPQLALERDVEPGQVLICARRRGASKSSGIQMELAGDG